MEFSARDSARWVPWRRLGLALAILLALDVIAILYLFPRAARGRIFTSADLPVAGIPVLVLGASVLPDREPSTVLEARLDAGLALFQQGKGSWLLVSGDNRAANYNEPQAMRRWLVRHGVPPERVINDFAGRRTYASLKRAQTIFGVTRLIIVTSDFHLARALFLARHMGMDAYGVPANTGDLPLHSRLTFWSREFVARNLAVWDAWFPPSTMLGPREVTPDDPPGPPNSAP